MMDRIDDAGTRGDQDAGGAQRGYGDGGYTPFGQLAGGGSAQAAGGFGGDNAGGYGQQTQTSQSGQGGLGPMTQGANYGQGGGQFGRAGQDSSSGAASFNAGQGSSQSQGGAGQRQSQGGFSQSQGGHGSSAAQYGQGGGEGTGGPSRDFGEASRSDPHDHHEPHYRQWRDTQLAGHDRDYARWRDEQARKYDEDYKGWRNERHSAFSKDFEGWRSGANSATAGAERPEPPVAREATVDPNAVHGANPTLANIADGHAGTHQHRRPEDDDRAETRS